jgi:hypothetical protein
MNGLGPRRRHIFVAINYPAVNSIVRVILEYETGHRRQSYV